MDAEIISVSLPGELADLIREQVANGTYASGSDLVKDALHLWQLRADRIAEIRKSLEEAANDPAPISASDMRAHFAERSADLPAKR